MTEREKMVEEMYLCADSAYCNWDNAPKDPIWRICEGLYDADYRKVPKGAVVLTKEEYEKLKNKPPFAIIKYDEDKMKEIAKEAAKNIVLEFTEKGKDEIRKETAREIFSSIAKDINDEKDYGFYLYIQTKAIHEYGVEVEE